MSLFVLLLLLQTPSADVKPPGPATALIIGRVVDASSGTPVSAATISVSGARAGGAVPRLITDSQGRFIYRNLRAGSYNLTATKPGYSDGAFGRRRPGGPSQSVELAVGERNTAVTIPIWKHATISGTVTDEAGEPVIGASLRSMRRTVANGRILFRDTGSSTTDDRGRFRIPRLDPGDYIVSVDVPNATVPASLVDAYRGASTPDDPQRRALSSTVFEVGSRSVSTTGSHVTRVGDHVITLPTSLTVPNATGWPTAVYSTTYYPGTSVPARAKVIAIGSGEERDAVDVQLQPVPAVRVSGSVMTPEGPAAFVALTLEHPPEQRFPNIAVATAATDANGRFVFAAVPAGAYVLRATQAPAAASAPERTSTIIQGPGGTMISTVMTGGGSTPLPTGPTWWLETPLQVAGRGVDDVVLQMQQGARFSGRIEFEGTAKPPAADRVSRIVVSFEPEDGERTRFSRRAEITENGTFRTLGLPGGEYLARVLGVPAPWALKSIMYKGRDLADQPIAISSNDIAGVVVTFTDRATTLSGTVHGGSGVDPDAAVLIFPTDSTLWWAALANRRVRHNRVSATGTYTFSGLPSGSYYVVAVEEETTSEWNTRESLEALASQATQITIVEGMPKTLDLRTVRR
jgi:hypothetical protein